MGRNRETKRQKLKIESLLAEFQTSVMAETERHRGSKAVGVVGDFILDIEALQTRYTKILDKLRLEVEASSIVSAIAAETQQKIEALAAQEIQRVRATGSV